MKKEELIVELECNDVQVNVDDTRITYCNSLDKELVKAIYNLQQENKQLKARIDKAIEKTKDLKQFVYDELVNRYVSGATETHYKIIDLLEILKGE